MKKLRTLAALIAALCCSIASADDIEVDGIYYNITSETDLAVTSGTYKYKGKIVIPESVIYNGSKYSVTRIRKDAFRNCKGLTSVTIGNSVTSIGEDAFEGCTGLTDIAIGKSLTTMKLGVFDECTSLASIVVHPDNKVYDSRDNCNAIIETSNNTLIRGCKSTTIPNSVTSIGPGAFFTCIGLASIVIPNSVTSIGQRAFWQCSRLKSITIPNSVTSIGADAFRDCN